MKKLKLNLQHLENAEVLTRAQLKTIVGGEDGSGPTVIKGKCTGSVGEWTYNNPVYYSVCWIDIEAYCSSNTGECLTS
jgi:hypothetical protein